MGIKEETILTDFDLSKYTGFRTGGRAKSIYAPVKILQLQKLLSELHSNEEKVFILGNGSNVLVPDEGYSGSVILTKKLSGIYINSNTITCEAGVSLNALCEKAAELSLSGIEELYGIPGTIGGAVYMNAGAFKTEIKDVVTSVKIIDNNGDYICYQSHECRFSYRYSRFLEENDSTIVEASFNLKKGSKEEIQKKMDMCLQRRKQQQPLEYPSCGSTFRRPNGSYASKLIDECGLKGLSFGGAMVSTKHAGFILNYNNASSKDILELIKVVKQTVLEQTGFLLETEVRIME